MSDLERVARALHETSVAMQDGERSDPVYLNWEDLPVRERKWFFAFAQTARRETLDGLMEPSEGMIEAGVTAELDSTLGSRVTNSWQAMLKHILEDGE